MRKLKFDNMLDIVTYASLLNVRPEGVCKSYSDQWYNLNYTGQYLCTKFALSRRFN
jgi:hypothetical protein